MTRTSRKDIVSRILQESGIGKEQLAVIGKIYALERKSKGEVQAYFSAGDNYISDYINRSCCAYVTLEGDVCETLTSKFLIRKYLRLAGIFEVDVAGVTSIGDLPTPYAVKDRICIIFSRSPF
jgi:hypothetical protein